MPARMREWRGIIFDEVSPRVRFDSLLRLNRWPNKQTLCCNADHVNQILCWNIVWHSESTACPYCRAVRLELAMGMGRRKCTCRLVRANHNKEGTIMRVKRFEGMCAVVTGAASGIGAAIATRLVAEGASVAGLDVAEGGLRHMEEALGDSFTGVLADVTVESDVARAVEAAVERYGPLRLDFNVAGAARGALVLDLDETDWDFTVDLVQKGVFFCTKHSGRHMRETGKPGAIVNVGSFNGRMPSFGGSAYSTAKAGVEMFSKNAALELAQFGIRVNAVLPGLVDTPMSASLNSNIPMREAYLERIPMARAATPDEIAAACLFMASADASYITGTALMVDGGWETSNFPRLAS